MVTGTLNFRSTRCRRSSRSQRDRPLGRVKTTTSSNRRRPSTSAIAVNGSGSPTIPSTLGEEKAANPFLRADVPEVAQSVGLAGRPAWEVFAEIRERKNSF